MRVDDASGEVLRGTVSGGSQMRAQSAAAVIRRGAVTAPDRVALTGDGISLTYAELEDRTTRLASALIAQGHHPGERIAVWSGTSVRYVELYLGAAKAGLVIAPINNLFRKDEALWIIGDARPGALFYDDSVAGLLDDELAGHFAPGRVIAMGMNRITAAATYADVVRAGSAAALALPAGHQPWVIGYTSGTTGRPKGAILSHRAAWSGMLLQAHTMRLERFSQRLYTANMSFVASAIAGIFPAFAVHGTVHLAAVTGADELVSLAQRLSVSALGLPGPWFADFADVVERDPRHLDGVTAVIHGGSAAPRDQAERLAGLIGDRLILSWGFTENCGVPAAATAPGDWSDQGVRSVATSVGRPCLDTAVRVVEQDGGDLPHDGASVGELIVQSPSLFDGYFGNEDATASAFADGWYRTGDLGTIDEDGFVRIVDRRSDLIVSGGMNIYPSELERVISELPGVAEVVVIGTPHERWGRTPVAVVRRSPDAAIDQPTVIRHCQERLASYKKPTRVVFVADFPRTASGKIRRPELEAVLRTADSAD